jgi:hypothetical protein
MSEHIKKALKSRLDELTDDGVSEPEARLNALKETLQDYVLDFIYHHPSYNSWVMYGSSALRIIHRLNRMSVDLDFEVDEAVTQAFLGRLSSEIGAHFLSAYGAGPDFLKIKVTTGRGLTLKFDVGQEFGLGQASSQVHLKIDLQQFRAPGHSTELRYVSRGQFSFAIRTYNLSTLMASKMAAIFLRGTRGTRVGVFGEKGRDIYDLLWYMEKGITPNLDYLLAKGVEAAKNPRDLMTALDARIIRVSDVNLKHDREPLFLKGESARDWLANWRGSYEQYRAERYQTVTVGELKKILIWERPEDFSNFNRSFGLAYDTVEGGEFKVTYRVTLEWLNVNRLISVEPTQGVLGRIEYRPVPKVPVDRGPNEQAKRLAALFFDKTERFLGKTGRSVFRVNLTTKVITTDLDERSLVAIDLNDLLP